MGYLINIVFNNRAFKITLFNIFSIGFMFDMDETGEYIIIKFELWKLSIAIELGVTK